MAQMTKYELKRKESIETRIRLLEQLEIESGPIVSSISPAPKVATAPKATTAPKAARENRKRKADSRGEDVKPSHRKSARVANKSAGIEAPSHLFEQLETLDDDDINSTDHEDFSAQHYLPVSTRTNVVYYATSEWKDLCTRHPDGTVETHLLQSSILPTPDTTEGSVSTSPNSEAKCAVDATSGPNLPHIPIEGVVGSVSLPACPQGSVATATGPKKKTKLTGIQKRIARAKRFGDIKVPIGTWCAGRSGFHENLVHRPTMAGIFGDPHHGAYSIAVSGGYEDNVDRGESFTFTGEGGKIKEKGKKRGGLCDAKANAPQALTKGNMALFMSCLNGRPVRVIRGGKSSWEGAPNKGYRYDGLYQVRRVWQQDGLSGWPVFQYALVRLGGQSPIDIYAGPGSPVADRLKEAELRMNKTD